LGVSHQQNDVPVTTPGENIYDNTGPPFMVQLAPHQAGGSMQSIVGTILIAQEGRFQLLDRDGVGHQFLLHHRSGVEPDQLPPLLHRRVRVAYRAAEMEHIIGHAVVHIELLEE
jgi:hypothetical protein